MKTLEISYEQAVEDLTEIVRARPEYVYQEDETTPVDCVYFIPQLEGEQDGLEPGKPACIVGQLLARHGFTLEDTTYTTDVIQGVTFSLLGNWNSGAGVDSLRSIGVLKIDSKTRNLLSHAQTSQDDGFTWKQSLEHAIKNAETGYAT